MQYLHKNKLWLGMILFFMLSFNTYAVCLMRAVFLQQLLYFDFLFCVLLLTAAGIDAYYYYKRQNVKKKLLNCNYVICRELETDENLEVAEHDVGVMEAQLRVQFEQNCDLQDYIAAWCHEVKLPLSACMLMNEKIKDGTLRCAQKEQLEIIRQRLNGALLGCKVQSSLFDLQICAADLLSCVKTALHNNQYFFIQQHFEIVLEVDALHIYTDPSWFVYVLDQLFQNSIKYCRQNPVLKIRSVSKDDEAVLIVEDNGEGIMQSDIRRIFERGYTGSNYHNGKYKSTGMGLYIVSQVLEKLGHSITVESEYGVYTRFCLTMKAANLTNM